MVDFNDVEEFISKINATSNLKTLQEQFTDTLIPLGFDKHTCLSFVDLNNPPSNSMLLFCFPEEWVTRYKQEKYFEDDVVLKTIHKTVRPCLWQNLNDIDQRNAQIFAEAQEFGIKNGLTIPITLSGYYPTTINIAGEHRDIDPRTYHAVHLMAVHYHHVLLRIGGQRYRPPMLTHRQSQCLYWAAKGKSDPDIAEILSITPRTVNYHIEIVREKFGVRTRAQVIAITTSCGLTFP
tara:strand:+ start:855 stop:1562 length:708 start_codon:yes stop_codon:yes gene_type:complete